MPRGIKNSAGLTPQQDIFADRIAAGDNQRQSAIAAGCSPSTAHVRGSLWMKVPAILKAIDQRQTAIRVAAARVAKGEAVDAAWVKRKSVELVERCMQEVKPALHPKTRKQLKDADGNALYTFNAAGAIAALRLVGDHVDVQAFEENVRLTHDLSLIERLQLGRQRARTALIEAGSRDTKEEILP